MINREKGSILVKYFKYHYENFKIVTRFVFK